MTNRILLALLALGGIAIGLVLLTNRSPSTGRAEPLGAAEAPLVPAQDFVPELAAPRSEGPAVGPPPSAPDTDEPEPTRAEAPTERDAELAEGHWVEGSVVLPAETPADEELFVVARGSRFEHGDDHRVPVALDGTFRVAFSARTRRGRLQLDGKYLYLESSPRVDLRDASEPLVLEPLLGARIVARVVAPEGLEELASELPAIQLWRNSGGSNRMASLGEGLAYELDGLPVGGAYALRLDSPEFEEIQRTGLALEPGEQRELELVLVRGATLSGTVRDEAGEPVEGVTVETQSRSGQWDWMRMPRSAESGSDGSFRLAGLSRRALQLRASARGFRPYEEELEPFGDSEEVTGHTITLERGNLVSGHVRWSDGSPASGAKVTHDDRPADVRFLVRFAEVGWETDEQGAFEITGLGDEAVRVDASAVRVEEISVASKITGRLRTKKERTTLRGSAEGVVPGTTGLVIVLGEGFEVSGVVRTADGAALPRFRVSATRLASNSPFRHAPEDEAGQSFETGDGSFVLTGLTPGRWELQASARGYAGSNVEIRRLPGDGEPVSLILDLNASVSGTVRSPGGAPVAGASVEAWISDSASIQFRITAECAPDGTFQLEDLSPGSPVRIRASAGGFATASYDLELAPGERRRNVDLVLGESASITGSLLALDGTPDGGRSVRARNMEGGDSRETQSGIDGTFRLEDLAPGRVRLTAESGPADMRQLLGGGLADEAALEMFERTADVELEAGETEHVVLRFADVDVVSVTGRVLAGGRPLAGAQLRFWAPSRGQSSSQLEVREDGTYSTAVPGPGEYMVHLWDRETGLQVDSDVTFPAVDRTVLDLELDVGSISGRVRGPAGEPLAGIAVGAEGRKPASEGDTRAWGRARTDEDGRYRLPLLVATTYEVTVTDGEYARAPTRRARDTYSPASVADVVVAPGAEVGGVDFLLQAGGTVAGRLLAPGGSAPRGIWVGVTDLAGRRLSVSGRSDDAGRFQIEGMPVGRSLLHVQSSAWTADRTEVQVRAGETTAVDIELRGSGSLQVTLRSADGGIPKGEVAVVGREDVTTYFMRDRTWHVGPLPAGECTLRATVGGVERTRTCLVVAGEETPVEIAFD